MYSKKGKISKRTKRRKYFRKNRYSKKKKYFRKTRYSKKRKHKRKNHLKKYYGGGRNICLQELQSMYDNFKNMLKQKEKEIIISNPNLITELFEYLNVDAPLEPCRIRSAKSKYDDKIIFINTEEKDKFVLKKKFDTIKIGGKEISYKKTSQQNKFIHWIKYNKYIQLLYTLLIIDKLIDQKILKSHPDLFKNCDEGEEFIIKKCIEDTVKIFKKMTPIQIECESHKSPNQINYYKKSNNIMKNITDLPKSFKKLLKYLKLKDHTLSLHTFGTDGPEVARKIKEINIVNRPNYTKVMFHYMRDFHKEPLDGMKHGEAERMNYLKILINELKEKPKRVWGLGDKSNKHDYSFLIKNTTTTNIITKDDLDIYKYEIIDHTKVDRESDPGKRIHKENIKKKEVIKYYKRLESNKNTLHISQQSFMNYWNFKFGKIIPIKKNYITIFFDDGLLINEKGKLDKDDKYLSVFNFTDKYEYEYYSSNISVKYGIQKPDRKTWDIFNNQNTFQIGHTKERPRNYALYNTDIHLGIVKVNIYDVVTNNNYFTSIIKDLIGDLKIPGRIPKIQIFVDLNSTVLPNDNNYLKGAFPKTNSFLYWDQKIKDK